METRNQAPKFQNEESGAKCVNYAIEYTIKHQQCSEHIVGKFMVY
jgi:hypothetical protein